jgi:hypothetical protein
MLFMRPPLAEENISMRRERSLSLSPPITFISLNKKGEKGPGDDLWILVKIPAQMLVEIPSAKVTLPIPTLLKIWCSWISSPPCVLLL